MKLILCHEQNGNDGPCRTFTNPNLRIGRIPEGEIVFTTEEWPMVSRYHATIYLDGSAWFVKDLDSTCGTFLNGQRVFSPMELKANDRIQCGPDGPIIHILAIGEGRADSCESNSDSIVETPVETPIFRRNITQPLSAFKHPRPDAKPQLLFSIPFGERDRDYAEAEKPKAGHKLRDLFKRKKGTGKKVLSSNVLPTLNHSEMAEIVRQQTLSDRPTKAFGDLVDCSVFAPPSAPVNSQFLVQVYVHSPEQQEEAAGYAREADESTTRRGVKSLESQIERGAKLQMHLTFPNFEVEEPIQELVWRGNPEAVKFGVTVPVAVSEGKSIGTVRVSCYGVPIGHIKFQVTIVAARNTVTLQKQEPVGEARRYEKAFASYASSDRIEVTKRLQMLSSLRISFFQDVLDLGPGERWEKALYRHIDESDLFLLFWSTAAKESNWVREELRYALRRKENDESAPPEIVPVIIEGPPPADPPEELAHMHFNDYLLYFMHR